MRFLLLIALLGACKERGTISIPAVEPCAAQAATAVAVYLKPATTCAALACGLPDFECSGDCIALCGDGYCTIDEWRGGLDVDPPSAGDYVLVMSFRYASGVDQGLVCVDVKVDADGTTSSTLLPTTEGQSCCI